MATTSVSYTVNSGHVSTPEFSYAAITMLDSSILPEADQLVVKLNGNTLTITTDYTVNSATDIVTISATIAEDDIVLIERVTDVDSPLVTYTNNALLDKDDLNTSITQLLHKLQELANTIGDSITLDLTYDCWDAQNKRICNVAAATASTDATNLAQVQNLIAGADTATIDNLEDWEFTGDGTTTDYVLSAAPSGLLTKDQLLVFVDGIYQRRDNYELTVAGSIKTLEFDTAPGAATRIAVITAQGIVSAVLASDTIDGDSIVDDSIGTAALNFGSGTAGRFLIIDANGDPTASVPDHDDISDFDSGVRENRLDQMTAPTANISMNSNKITDLTAGASGSTNACNVAQMETYADAAAASAASSVNISGTTVVVSSSTGLTTAYERSNASSQTKLVVATLGSSSTNDIQISIKDSGGSYSVCAVAKTNAVSNLRIPVTFMVQAGGSYKIQGVGSTGTLYYLTEQAF